MSIASLAEERFKEILRSNLTPAKAISDPVHLRGRAKLLKQIDWAFNSPGKHAFIYGERGVGKTSLAQTAALLHSSSEARPIQIACDEYVTFYKMVSDIARRALPPQDVMQRSVTNRTGKLSLFGFSAELQTGIQKGVIPPVESLNDAVVLLQYVAGLHHGEPVLIIDEFDQVRDREDQKRFADLIKQISDQNVSLKLIFCGIGQSLEDLIGVHLSTDRYLAPIPVEPLSHDALWEILETTADQLGVEVGREEKVRISQISDGFPYYVHLIGEHMFRSMFYDEALVERVGLRHFDEGMRGAVSEALASLKQAYLMAVHKRSDDYEEVLWAVADDTMLERQTAEIYSRSYLPIMEMRNLKLKRDEQRAPLDQKTFYQRMNALKRASHGQILIGSKTGWYRFRENWMRGYVRLKAEQKGVALGIDHHLAERPPHRRWDGPDAA
ncbi:MAG: ATP-binding protein [Hyphomicrobium sp.]|nr:ATP-binding protein [Hyphomicrobium sp.]